MKKKICNLALLGFLTAGLFVFTTQTAKAQYYYYNSYRGYSNFYRPNVYYGGYYGGFQPYVPLYHGPSFQIRPVYHATSVHWTPQLGLHTHGHFHNTLQYVPGHIDHLHGNHIHVNPLYHNH